MSSMLSDHFLIDSEFSLERPFSLSTSVSHRSYRLININAFPLDLEDIQLLLDLPKGLDQLVDMHDSTLSKGKCDEDGCDINCFFFCPRQAGN